MFYLTCKECGHQREHPFANWYYTCGTCTHRIRKAKRRKPPREMHEPPAYVAKTPRRPWRGSAACCWVPDKMMNPQVGSVKKHCWRDLGKSRVTNKVARTKQRRLDRYLCENPEE